MLFLLQAVLAFHWHPPTRAPFLGLRTRPPLAVIDLGRPTVSDETGGDRTVSSVSYREQFEELFSKPLKTSVPVPKPSNGAQAVERGAKKVLFSNVFGTLMRSPFSRSGAWSSTDVRSSTTYSTMPSTHATLHALPASPRAYTRALFHTCSSAG